MSKILLVGCGKMGSALLAGWLEQGIAREDMMVVEPSAVGVLLGIPAVHGDHEIPDSFIPDVVVLAVKPQVMAEVLPPYGRFGDATFLSIAAGKTVAFLKGHLGQGCAVVRAMPNTPAQVGRGVSVCVGRVDAARAELCRSLLAAVGEVEWIADEAQMDAVTALSGSGPAYVFLLAEAMAQAGVRAGLPEDLATRLARATIAGSGELLARSRETAAQLRANVTSPGGTTAAALAVLMDNQAGFPGLMARAVQAAAARSRELAG